MARRDRGDSGQRAPAPSARPGLRSEEGRALREAATVARAPAEPARTSRSSGFRLAAGRGQRPGVSAPAEDPAASQRTHPFASFPSPLAPAHSPPPQKKARPPGTRPRSGRSRSAPSSIPGGRGRARGRREGAIQRGCAGMLPRRPSAAVRLPAPNSEPSSRGGWTHAACVSRSGTGVAWRGRCLLSAGARGRRTDTRSQEAGGSSVRPGGGVRRRLEGAGAVEWTAPLLLAWGLLSTSGPWSKDREVGAAAEGDAR